jgi:hypothetical protein
LHGERAVVSEDELGWLFGDDTSPGPVFRLSLGETRLRAIHAPVAGLGSLIARDSGNAGR